MLIIGGGSERFRRLSVCIPALHHGVFWQPADFQKSRADHSLCNSKLHSCRIMYSHLPERWTRFESSNRANLESFFQSNKFTPRCSSSNCGSQSSFLVHSPASCLTCWVGCIHLPAAWGFMLTNGTASYWLIPMAMCFTPESSVVNLSTVGLITSVVAEAAKQLLLTPEETKCSTLRFKEHCYGDPNVWAVHEGEVIHAVLYDVRPSLTTRVT